MKKKSILIEIISIKKLKNKLYLGTSLSLILSSPLSAEWVEYINDASITIAHSDNVNLTAFSNDKLSDTSINPQYTFGRYYQMDNFTRLRLDLGLSANFYNDFNKLNSVDAMGSAIVRHKFGIGPTKPWMRGNLSFGKKEADVVSRDSDLYELGLSTGRRFNERASGQIGISYNKRDGGLGSAVITEIPTNVYDTENTSLSASFGYLLDERSQLSANWTHRNGDFFSACTGDNLSIVIDREKDNVKALTKDEVFGICAYRAEGSSNALQLQYNYAVSRHSSLNLGYQVIKGEADVLDYDTAIWNASFMYSR